MKTGRPIRIAITLGDPAGIGPEVVLKSILLLKPRIDDGSLVPTLVGNPASLKAAQALIRELEDGSAHSLGITLIPIAPELSQPAYGRVSAEAGRIAHDSIIAAVQLATDGDVDAVVTAPVNKEAINLAGIPFVGHTELIATAVGAEDSCMMLAHGKLFVSHVTTHIPLARVSERISMQRVERVIAMTHSGLVDMGLPRPRIGVCGLNPHCGEGGVLGREDLETVEPAVRRADAAGIDVRGPIPGDSIFPRALGGEFDAVVAMYHDQGHIPIKMLGFSVNQSTGRWDAVNGVNVTLGLPIVRTSVDHGTAFDIAGKGIAKSESMIEAVECAVRIARVRLYQTEIGRQKSSAIRSLR